MMSNRISFLQITKTWILPCPFSSMSLVEEHTARKMKGLAQHCYVISYFQLKSLNPHYIKSAYSNAESFCHQEHLLKTTQLLSNLIPPCFYNLTNLVNAPVVLMPHTVVRRAKEFAYLHDSIYNFSVYYDEARFTVRLMGSVYLVGCDLHVACAWSTIPGPLLAGMGI